MVTKRKGLRPVTLHGLRRSRLERSAIVPGKEADKSALFCVADREDHSLMVRSMVVDKELMAHGDADFHHASQTSQRPCMLSYHRAREPCPRKPCTFCSSFTHNVHNEHTGSVRLLIAGASPGDIIASRPCERRQAFDVEADRAIQWFYGNPMSPHVVTGDRTGCWSWLLILNVSSFDASCSPISSSSRKWTLMVRSAARCFTDMFRAKAPWLRTSMCMFEAAMTRTNHALDVREWRRTYSR